MHLALIQYLIKIDDLDLHLQVHLAIVLRLRHVYELVIFTDHGPRGCPALTAVLKYLQSKVHFNSFIYLLFFCFNGISVTE